MQQKKIEIKENMSFQFGDVLSHNKLWRAGMHYDYEFFVVSHETKKGTIMGWYLDCEKTYLNHDFGYSTVNFKANMHKRDKLKRLRHPRMWEKMDASKIEDGIVATSCVN